MNPNTRVAVSALAVVAFMGSMAWAAIPFYSWFCRVTGYGGATVEGQGASEVLDRTMAIRFDASTEPGMPWEFKPVERQTEIRIGETGLAFYEAYNPTDRVVAGQASYNVAPYEAGGYFTKIDCFCFTEQVLQPGERVMMPVTYYVDPEIVKDRDAKFVKHITLSYTFYEIPLPEKQAALDGDLTDQ
ncbi:cytochrome c oxidase assembly protein [Oceaniglobus roseus]|uniref:cytochrome c oxidase assembly protein n=1 Tax=Oceaniglobus roseus TaxID=1737570 RepID=UPI000C7EA75B|nr:cytochrome c oxidase assembly protein [Kandeliimicrobium roseum]